LSFISYWECWPTFRRAIWLIKMLQLRWHFCGTNVASLPVACGYLCARLATHVLWGRGGKTSPWWFPNAAIDALEKCQKFCTSSSWERLLRRANIWLNLQFVALYTKSLFIATNLHKKKKLCKCWNTFECETNLATQ